MSALAVAASADENENHESGYYSFSGGHLIAAYKSEFFPVLSGDRRGVFVDTDQGLKRVRYDSACRLLVKPVVSDRIVEISGIKFGFDNLQHSRNEAAAMSQMMQDEISTERSILMRGGGIAGTPPGGHDPELQAMLNEMKTVQGENSEFIQETLDNDAYRRGVLSDLINVKFDLLSGDDLEHVYCAMVVRFLRRDQNMEGKFSRTGIVRMKRIGNLSGGKSKRVRFSYPLPEGFVNEHGIELFLYRGDGEPLATNLSKNLRLVDTSEVP
ncbi:MAG: hypothetical protein SynsKO_06750 [Synoicihabitans sp.]